MDFLVTLILISISLTAGYLINQFTDSLKKFISVPFIGSFLFISFLLLFEFLFKWEVSIPYPLERTLVTVFILTIGYEIGLKWNFTYLKQLFFLTLVSSILILILYTVSLVFPVDLRLYIGGFMFAWNNELITEIVPQHMIEEFTFWARIEMVIVFLGTPLFLSWLNKKIDGEETSNKRKDKNIPFKEVNVTTICIIVGTSIGIVFVKNFILLDAIPFIFDFVIALGIGFLYGFLQKQKNKKTHSSMTIKFAGTIGLYGFIIIEIGRIVHLTWDFMNYSILTLLFVKTIIIGIIVYFLASLFLSHLRKNEFLVAIAAGWTFILNTPVTCMHAMRTVVDRYGPAELILIVPPVILWLINYLHVYIAQMFPIL